MYLTKWYDSNFTIYATSETYGLGVAPLQGGEGNSEHTISAIDRFYVLDQCENVVGVYWDWPGAN